MSKRFDTALSALSSPVSDALYRLPPEIKQQVCEIRLRVQRPICLCTFDTVYFPTQSGAVSRRIERDSLTATKFDLAESFRTLCGFSVYAHQSEIQNGFVTYLGGHRVGVCGTAVVENGRIINIRDITSMNVRVAREAFGAADPLVKQLGNALTEGLLLCGRPGCGKTTVLRDLCRQLASGGLGAMKKVALIDERGEVAGVVSGVPQNDVGVCCDVLDGYPKSEGILQAIRCLSPEVILCDELGGGDDIAAIRAGVHAGAGIITTLHASSPDDLERRPQARVLLETGAFSNIAFLDSTERFGQLQEVIPLAALDR